MKSWLKRLKKVLSLPLAEKRLFFRVFAVVLIMRAGLRFLSFSSFKTLYADVLLKRRSHHLTEEDLRKTIGAIRGVSGALSALCLPQALSLKYFLRGDAEAELIIGVMKGQSLEAHAWVEKNGAILIGDLPGTDFQALWTWK